MRAATTDRAIYQTDRSFLEREPVLTLDAIAPHPVPVLVSAAAHFALVQYRF